MEIKVKAVDFEEKSTQEIEKELLDKAENENSGENEANVVRVEDFLPPSPLFSLSQRAE